MPGKFSVTVAPNGARRDKADHTALPLSIAELAQTAQACFTAGADCIHLHVRDGKGQHTLDAGRYKETIFAIKQTTPEMTVQITTEAVGLYDVPAQYACLKQVQPTAVSVSVREMARDIKAATKLYGFAVEAGIDLQHILYDTKDVALLHDWHQSGIVAASLHSVLFVLGQYKPPVLAEPKELAGFLHASSGKNFNWAVCAFGQNELACMHEALKRGGHIRVGFENNTQLPDGSFAVDNAQLVAQAVNAGMQLGLRPYTQTELL